MGKREFLVFKLGKQEYAVDIHKVQEIKNYEHPTAIAEQHHFVKGVINLRGDIVPILDLRIKFNLPCEYNDFTVVVILKLHDKHTGIVVDSVCDVISVEVDNIQQVNGANNMVSNHALLGLITLEERMIQIINVDGFIYETT